MESTATASYTVNPEFASMDNTKVEELVTMYNLSEDNWVEHSKPKKDKDPLVWIWKSAVKPDSKTQVNGKFAMIFPGIAPEVISNILDFEERQKWEKLPTVELIEKDEGNLSFTFYACMKKPGVPLVSQRDVVVKMF
jgi:hypothetical protein